ncbi:EamA domain-containing protein [Kerstersia similis]
MTVAMLISGTIGWLVIETAMPVMAVVFWRCALGGLAMLLACAGLGVFRGTMPGWRKLAWVALGGVALVANWYCLFTAYSHSSIAVATITYHTQPFMLVALGAIFFGERPGMRQLGWLGLAFAGVLLIVVGGQQGDSASRTYLYGIALALAAAFFYAIAAAITKRLSDVPPHLIVLIQMGAGVLLLWPAAQLPHGSDAGATWGLLLTLGFVHTGLMSTLLYGALQKISTVLVGALSFIYPVMAVGVDAWAFGHRLGGLQILGALGILLAVAGMNFGWRWPGKSLRVAAQKPG